MSRRIIEIGEALAGFYQLVAQRFCPPSPSLSALTALE